MRLRTARRWVRRIHVVLVATTLTVVGCSGADQTDQTTRAVPRELDGLDGTTVALSVSGRPSVIAFVAAWCAPCHRELPELESLHQRRGDTMTIVAVAVEEESDATRKLVADTGITFPVALDPDGTMFAAAGFTALPDTLILDGSGEIAKRLIGVQSVESIEEALAALPPET